MSNRTYVCFDCRTTERVDTNRITRNCRKCRKPAEHVYYKFKIPAKRDDDGWDALMWRVRPLNAAMQRRALENLRLKRSRLERSLATTPPTRAERRRLLRQQIREIGKSRDAWLRW